MLVAVNETADGVSSQVGGSDIIRTNSTGRRRGWGGAGFCDGSARGRGDAPVGRPALGHGDRSWDGGCEGDEGEEEGGGEGEVHFVGWLMEGLVVDGLTDSCGK